MIPALLDHLWQSTAFGGAVALLALAFRRGSASLRFRLWLAASIKFLVPFALLSAIGQRFVPATGPGPELSVIGAAGEPFSRLVTGPVVKADDLTPVFDPAPWLLALWAAGVVVISAVWLLRWRKLWTVLRTSRPLPWTGPIPVRISPSLLEPGLVGLLRPVLLLPESLPSSLPSDEIDAILAHEAVHFRRRDNRWGAVHMLVETLFWFHPMTWWIGRRLVVERERACDDAVVQSGHDREVYARAVLESCRLYLRLPLACVSAVSGANLANRIEDIMTAPAPAQVTAQQRRLLFAAGLLTVAVPVLTGFASGPGVPLGSWLFDPGPTPAQVAHDLADQKRPRTAVAFDPARFDRYVGDYELAPYGIMTVSRRGDRFFTQLTGQNAAELYPESDRGFFYKVVPGQISFVTGPTGRTDALIVHQNGFNQRLPRLEPEAAARLRATLARRIADNRPSPGTQAWVRSFLDSIAAGRPDYSGMTPQLAETAREQWQAIWAKYHPYGRLEAVRFLRVSPQGADLYEADFEKGRMFVRIPPLVRNKAPGLFIRPM